MRALPIYSRKDVPIAAANVTPESRWYIERMARIFKAEDLVPWLQDDAEELSDDNSIAKIMRDVAEEATEEDLLDGTVLIAGIIGGDEYSEAGVYERLKAIVGSVRKVKTPEGVKRYGLPIGSIIKSKSTWDKLNIGAHITDPSSGYNAVVQPDGKGGFHWAAYSKNSANKKTGSAADYASAKNAALDAIESLTKPAPKAVIPKSAKSAPKPKPSKPSASASAFTTGKQKKLGVVYKVGQTHPEATIPKKTLADGETPSIGQKVIHQDGSTGKIVKTWQTHSTVEFDDTSKKSKSVPNSKLNAAGNQSQNAGGGSANSNDDELSMSNWDTIDSSIYTGFKNIKFTASDGSYAIVTTSPNKYAISSDIPTNALYFEKTAPSMVQPFTPEKAFESAVAHLKANYPDVYDQVKNSKFKGKISTPKASNPSTPSPSTPSSVDDKLWKTGSTGKAYMGLTTNGAIANSSHPNTLASGVVVQPDGVWFVVKNGKKVHIGKEATQAEAKKSAGAYFATAHGDVLTNISAAPTSATSKYKSVSNDVGNSTTTHNDWSSDGISKFQALAPPDGHDNGFDSSLPDSVFTDKSAAPGSADNPKFWKPSSSAYKVYGAWLTNPHKDKWNSSEYNKIKAYTGNLYSSITYDIKHGSAPGSGTQKHLNVMEKAFKNPKNPINKTDEWFVTTRGGSPAEMNGLGLNSYSTVSEIKAHIGKTWSPNTPRSTSLSTQPAFSGHCRFIYKIKPGSSVIYAGYTPGHEYLSNHPGEKEVMIPHGAKAKIVDVVPSTASGHKVDVVIELSTED